MAKYTRLTFVQRALAAIDSDSVTSIGESVEAEQVAEILDTVYDRILREYNWPNLYSEFSLNTTAEDHKMRLPTDCLQLDTCWYNKKEVVYITPKEMRELLNSRDTALTNVDDNGALNDIDPTYYTTFDDDYIVFDSYNGSLEENKSVCHGILTPAQLLLDTDIPVLPERFHSIILDGLIAEVMQTLKGDSFGYNVFSKKYKNGIIKMKRWAQRVNVEKTYANSSNYSRSKP